MAEIKSVNANEGLRIFEDVDPFAFLNSTPSRLPIKQCVHELENLAEIVGQSIKCLNSPNLHSLLLYFEIGFTGSNHIPTAFLSQLGYSTVNQAPVEQLAGFITREIQYLSFRCELPKDAEENNVTTEPHLDLYWMAESSNKRCLVGTMWPCRKSATLYLNRLQYSIVSLDKARKSHADTSASAQQLAEYGRILEYVKQSLLPLACMLTNYQIQTTLT